MRLESSPWVSLLLALLGVAGFPRFAHAGDNPGYDRPGIGFSPAVLAAGDVTWEQGLPDWSREAGVSLYAGDSLLRIGLGGPLELQLGSSFNCRSGAVTSRCGRGDSSVGVKLALPGSADFAWGLLGNVTLTDGADAFSGGDREYLLGAAFGWSLGARNSLGAYLEATRTAGVDGQLVALSAGRSLTDSLGAYVEVAWQHADAAGSGSQGGAGITWQLTPRVQLDGSFRRRIDGAVNRWEAGFGVAVFFGRL